MFKKTSIFILFLLLPLCSSAMRYTMPAPGNDVIGNITTVRAEYGDTLSNIGANYGLGIHEMFEANPAISRDELEGGEEIVIPTQFILPKWRQGIVINVAECRLYYFTPDGRYVLTYPVGLGRSGWRTPLTSTTVTRKATNPTWTVPATIREYVYEQTGNVLPDAVKPGPENPLGGHAMYLAKNGYLIHGTNQPWTIGKLDSAGCIRLHNADVAELYAHVKPGTSVKIVHQPYKAGWQDGRLLLEAHVPVNIQQAPSDLNVLSVEKSLIGQVKSPEMIDWDKVRELVNHENGMPEAISVSYR